MDGEIDVSSKNWKQHDSFYGKWEKPFISICKMFSGNFLPKSGRIGFILLILQGWKDLKQASVTSSHGMSMATSQTFIDADVSIFFANLTLRFD